MLDIKAFPTSYFIKDSDTYEVKGTLELNDMVNLIPNKGYLSL
jgi:hypothetical protein